jgi:hypothetical protein
MDTQVQKALRTANRPEKNLLYHIIVKISRLKNKERILKIAREKHQLTNKGKHIRITSDLSKETLKARKA